MASVGATRGGRQKESPALIEARSSYTRATEDNNAAAMLAIAHTLLALSPTLGTAQQIVNTVPATLPNRAAIKLKLAFLRSYTVEPCIPFLRALALLHGIALTVKVGEFNSYVQEVIDPASWLYQFNPDIIILAAQTRDVAPYLWNSTGAASPEEAVSIVDDIVSSIASIIDGVRQISAASLIIQNLEQPDVLNSGLLDSRGETGQAALISMVNKRLTLEALKHDGVFTLDYDALIARHGRARWTDERKWLTSRSPVAADCLIFAAREYLRFILPLAGRLSKVLVVDLDNTLWGGVIGEDGPTGIKIGLEYPGATYLALQRAVMRIAERGVLLAICSKNNLADAMTALENHPDMLLRPKDFSAIRINWTDKAQNLRDIASELNVGIDTLAFLDDNPAERHRVRLELPEVSVVEMPLDPSTFASTLLSYPTFERLTITAEDKARRGYYTAQRERKSTESAAGSLEDYYRSLEMTATFVDLTPATLARIAQLTQKTNQLNTTTKRYTESEVHAMAGDPTWHLFGVRITDKFGDNGIVGAVFLKLNAATAEIDTFLLSCRVIGRTVETLMLSRACDVGIAAGCTKLTGWFLPTKKNEPAAKIYANGGFTKIEETEDGSLWQFSLQHHLIKRPEWIN